MLGHIKNKMIKNSYQFRANLKDLWHHLSKRRQTQFCLMLILMILASFMEVISIGAVLPFLGILTAPEYVYNHELMLPVINILGLTKPNQIILPITVIFIITTLSAAFIRLLLLYGMTRLSFAAGADMSIGIFRKTLHQKYSVHLNRNSSEVINGVITKTGEVIGGIFSPILTLISSVLLMVGVMSALITIDAKIALSAFSGFSLMYWAVIKFTHKQVHKNGKCVAEESTRMIKILQEGLGGIRDILIDGSQEYYAKLYRHSDLAFRRASGSNVFISGSPRYAMEAIGMILIAILAYFMLQQKNGGITIIPVLGALAIGAQKLLPALQQSYNAINGIKGSTYILNDVINLLDQPLPDYATQPSPEPIAFQKEINLKNISFSYNNNSTLILNNVNLNIEKGSRVGFIGETGAGKSTLIDVIMGLLEPKNGSIFIDNIELNRDNLRSWQVRIAHVPQNIFLTDGTIEENVAFGVSAELIDHDRVVRAVEQAKIKDMVESWDLKYNTYVGERGVRISGGQRQRIGIARALYKQANVLIFDEATNALDIETEKAVMESIKDLGKDLTILIIAHRLSTLKLCNQIVELSKDGIRHWNQ